MKWDHFFQVIHFHRQCNHMTITSIYEYVSTHYKFIDTTAATNNGRGWVDPFVTSSLPLHPAITSLYPWELLTSPARVSLIKMWCPWSLSLLGRRKVAKPHYGRSRQNISPLSMQTCPDHRNCLPTSFSALQSTFPLVTSGCLLTYFTHLCQASPLPMLRCVFPSTLSRYTISHVYLEA
jgi:hypothetical protein